MTATASVPLREQAELIAHRGGHLQVITCAGAGKTEAVSRRIASLIEDGIKPGYIVAFTFTERAAESLKTRITPRIAEVKGQAFVDRLGPMFAGTIQSYRLRRTNDLSEFYLLVTRGLWPHTQLTSWRRCLESLGPITSSFLYGRSHPLREKGHDRLLQDVPSTSKPTRV